MKKEIAEQWVKALRSGEYKQGKQWLRKDEKFCCLGVLCDISNLSTWESSFEHLSYLGRSDILPLGVKLWAGTRTFSCIIGVAKGLTTLNDEGKSFNEIADIIEKNWQEL